MDLKKKGHFVIKFDKLDVRFYDSIGSTNEEAKTLIRLGKISARTLIYANTQTDGRGRIGHKWNSKSRENIYMTLVIPNVDFSEKLSRITILTGMAASDVLNFKLQCDLVQLKWVNDLFVYNKKLGGILTETLHFNQTYYLIIGIGINIRLFVEDLEEELKESAISLEQIKPMFWFDKEELIREICSKVLEEVSAYTEDQNFKRKIKDYKKRCITIGKNVHVSDYHDQYECFAEDINEEGNLIVRFSDGKRKVLTSGDVSVGLMDG